MFSALHAAGTFPCPTRLQLKPIIQIAGNTPEGSEEKFNVELSLCDFNLMKTWVHFSQAGLLLASVTEQLSFKEEVLNGESMDAWPLGIGAGTEAQRIP